jgi:hypothetical protein
VSARGNRDQAKAKQRLACWSHRSDRQFPYPA